MTCQHEGRLLEIAPQFVTATAEIEPVRARHESCNDRYLGWPGLSPLSNRDMMATSSPRLTQLSGFRSLITLPNILLVSLGFCECFLAYCQQSPLNDQNGLPLAPVPPSALCFS